ncbi:beta strand repeat-containing protein [Methylobacterium sp. J-068]|uniref:beta strand repeat-containing protein n=1 Tax=Methylobacterium sp. J-068 TaxID=2836649 RepID=UPI001FB99E1E|nr:sialate O-acetylesterase [Methylobacterium sp. J-068]MCJ2034860.1 cadherin domain-containing protein [Methylobacterium sp. J-068]
MIFLQRDGDSADVRFTGDQARVLNKAGQVVVDWTAGGILHGVPQGDGYRLEVKTGATVKADDLAIGAVVFTIGQSNIERWYNTPSAVPDAASGTYQMEADGSIGHVEGGASTYFAENYGAETGVPVLMVAAAKGGTALVAAADKGNGYWMDTSAGSLYATALSLLAKVGGAAEVVLWAQGETDASANVTTSTYAAALNTFMGRVLNDFHSGHVLIQEIGPHGDNDDKYDAVRLAQHQVADALAGVDIGAATTDLNTIEDGIHLTGASRVTAADRLLDAALAFQGIDISRAVQNGADLATGSDHLVGTEGRDELHGRAGNDILDGGGGSDALFGDAGDDVINGGAGVDLIRGGAGNDTIDGGDDSDVISGGDGSDIIRGGAGADEIWADAGDDVITGGAGNDVISGGAGIDTAVFSGKFAGYRIVTNGVTATVTDIDLTDGNDGTDTLDGVEYLSFSDKPQYDIKGTGLPSLFTPSDDYVDFATVVAGTYAPTSSHAGLAGNDEIYLPKDAAAAQAAGYDTTVAMDGGDGNDVIIGGSLDDWMKGGAGDDILNGGAGSDRMEGGLGNDRYYVDTTAVGSTGDLVVEKANEGIDTVISTVTFTLKSNVENLTLVGTDNINGTGNELDNVIAGNDGNNIINANAGNDTLLGGAGDDSLRGGLGNDFIDGGLGRDTAVFAGKFADYRIVDVGGAVTVTDLNPADTDEGTDTIQGVELLKFSDKTYTVNIPNGLFTNGNDTVDFATVTAGSYQAGTQYAAGAGDDVVHLAGTAAAAAAAGYDTTLAFDGGLGNDTITGGGLNDWIKGGDGDDVIDGGAGSDRMEGGLGNDTYYVDVTAVGTSGDLVIEKFNEGVDTVISTVTHTLKSNVENLTLVGTGEISGFGNELANTIIGNDAKNSLKGDLGNDVLYGMGGNDSITGGAGNDTIDGGLGTDIALYLGVRADYTVTITAGRVVITDNNPADIGGDEGTDTLVGVEILKFSDGTLAVPLGGAPTALALSHAEVPENSPGGTLVGTFSATDPDAGDSFTYTLLDSAGGAFAIQGADLVVAAGAVLDFETNPSLTVTARVSDGGGHTFDRTFTIALSDVDGPPITGTAAADKLIGTQEGETIDGGLGADTMTGGAGNDTYIVDNSKDVVVELAGGGIDTVRSSVSFTLGANIENLVLTGAASKGTGNALDNVLTGNDANNTLDGGLGADTMAGGLGNDVYVVDNIGDRVIEFADAGNDTIKTTLATYALGIGNAVEALTFIGMGDFQGTGNELANTITGGAGNDTLDGGPDTVKDALKGGLGDDTYIVGINDTVTEAADAGHDTVRTGLATYKLGANLEDLVYTGAGDFKGTGNTLDNLIKGGAGNDTLDGGAGADLLVGGAGNDTYLIDSPGDRISERVDPNDAASADAGGIDTVLIKTGLTQYALGSGSFLENLTYSGTSAFQAIGNERDNTLVTGAGNDVLSGGLGHDVLTGGKGADQFLFNAPGEGTDTITDFTQSQLDKIAVTGANFGGLSAGSALPADWFVLGTSATSADHGQFLFDAQALTLSWDADGTGTAAPVVEIAQFAKALTLHASDILVV